MLALRKVFCVALALELLLTGSVMSGASAAFVQPQTPTAAFILRDGTPVKLRLNRTVSSADARLNEQIEFEVLEEIRVDDAIVVAKGSTAWATVTEVQKKRRLGRGGKLNMNIDAVRLVNGEKTALRAVKDGEGGGHTGKMTGAIVATSIVFFPAAPLFLFMKGKDITIPQGTEITAFINGDATISSVISTGTPIGVAPQTSVSTNLASVSITSEPVGSDIIIDGKYVGNTPSTITLPPGDHLILIEKQGFRPWQRTMTVAPNSALTVAPSLEKLP